jgi:hypothetical protein
VAQPQVRVEAQLGQGQVLVVDDLGQAAADDLLERVVARLGGEPAKMQLERQPAGAAVTGGGPPDREVGVRSTGSSTRAARARGPHDEQGRDQRGRGEQAAAT